MEFGTWTATALFASLKPKVEINCGRSCRFAVGVVVLTCAACVPEGVVVFAAGDIITVFDCVEHGRSMSIALAGCW